MSSLGAAGGKLAQIGGASVALKRLASLTTLTADDLRVLSSLKSRTICSGSIIQAQAEAEGGWIILSGWCGRLGSGCSDNQPVTTVLLPGDSFGLGAAPWAGDLLPVRTLTDCIVLDAAPIRQLVRLRPPAHVRLVDACHKASWFEQVYTLNHITRLNALNAYQRVGHFFTELLARLQIVGLAPDNAFSVPIRQRALAGILGLSTIHFNRTTRLMKKNGVASADRGGVRIIQPQELAKLVSYADGSFPQSSPSHPHSAALVIK